jgi:hypothetical protein
MDTIGPTYQSEYNNMRARWVELGSTDDRLERLFDWYCVLEDITNQNTKIDSELVELREIERKCGEIDMGSCFSEEEAHKILELTAVRIRYLLKYKEKNVNIINQIRESIYL